MSWRIRVRTRIALWIGFALLAVWIIAARLQLTVDLASFLPEPSTAEERVLVDRLGQGPGSQLIFISLPVPPGQPPEASSAHLKTALAGSGLFSQVINGAEQIGAGSIPPVIWRHRYLLRNIDLSVAGLRQAMQARLADMAVFSDPQSLELVAADPFLAAVEVMEALAWPGLEDEGAWTSADGKTAYLIARTLTPAFEIGAQQAAVDTIFAATRVLTDDEPELHGVGVYGVELQETIRAEAQSRSALAALGVALVLLIAYRRFKVLAVAALPLMLGCLGGLAAVALLFEKVHGITLAFGFTLFGVAVDYPIHLMSHLRRGRESMQAIWPTLWLGASSTIIGYLAIAAAGSRGLAQLGVFSAVGVTVTLCATRSLLPDLAGNSGPATDEDATSYRPVFRHGVWITALLLGTLLLVSSQGRIWSNDLSSLTPLPAERLAQDQELRQTLGAPDIRYLVATSAASREGVLVRSEQLADLLDAAQAEGVIEAFQIVSRVLPSRATQERRAQRLKTVEDLRARVSAAAAGTPFRRGAFEPFVAAVSSMSAQTDLLDPAAFEGTVLEDFVEGNLYFDGARWVSLATLHGLRDAKRLSALLASGSSEATLVDLRAASESLVAGYRLRVFSVLGLALLAIGILLSWKVAVSARLVWVAGTLAASLVSTVALNTLLLGSLSLFSLIAIVLVAGLGLDYGLFVSRTEHGSAGLRDTRHAVNVCAASTFVAFFVLALSSVPILRGIGVSVAAGVALSFVIARLGVRHHAV